METRVDIEEAINLADKMPEKVEFMRKELLRRLKDIMLLTLILIQIINIL